MLSVSDKDDSVNELSQEISESMKLHILGRQGGGKMLLKYIMQLANYF